MRPSFAFFCAAALALVCLTQGCKSRQLAHLQQSILEKKALPPNGVRIQDNLFVDETEVSNIDYQEYLFWLAQVFGSTSPKYVAALPDTIFWGGEPYPLFPDEYFRRFADYPVVGLSFEKASAYSDWRTDRVYEMILMKLGKIKPNPQQNSDNHFTTKRYQSGQYMGYVPDHAVLVPRFRLPAEAEWEMAASAHLDTQQYPQGYNFELCRKTRYFKRYGDCFLKTKPAQKTSVPPPGDVVGQPAPCESFMPNDFGLYHMIGNVAEMTAQPGVAKGGHYLLPSEQCTVAGRVTYDKPTKWLGFRNVCSWEKY